MSLREFIIQNEIDIPGFDIAKTIGYIFMLLLILFLVSENPMINLDEIVKNHPTINIDDLKILSKISFLLIIFCIGIALLSAVITQRMLEIKVNNLRKLVPLFYSKLLINISVLILILVISAWVILVGGIKNSPYSTLLSMSPILLSIQIFRDKKLNKDKLLISLKKSDNSKISEKDIKSWRNTNKFIDIIGYIPMAIIIITLIVGYFEIEVMQCKIIELSKTLWFNKLFYFIYYSSVLIAIISILPPSWTKELTRKIYSHLGM